jgi:hypothetical protein
VGFPDPFGIDFAPELTGQLRTLPVEARAALAEVLESVAFDPIGSGVRYLESLPEEWRATFFGDGVGFVAYVVAAKYRRIYVTHITWAG